MYDLLWKHLTTEYLYPFLGRSLSQTAEIFVQALKMALYLTSFGITLIQATTQVTNKRFMFVDSKSKIICRSPFVYIFITWAATVSKQYVRKQWHLLVCIGTVRYDMSGCSRFVKEDWFHSLRWSNRGQRHTTLIWTQFYFTDSHTQNKNNIAETRCGSDDRGEGNTSCVHTESHHSQRPQGAPVLRPYWSRWTRLINKLNQLKKIS